MNGNFKSIVWSLEAEEDLDEIEYYYLKFFPEKASENIVNIILKVEETVFAKQWQIDEYDPSCRRMIINKKFRVLYKVIDETILITRIYSTQKDPDNIFKN
jgi:plasmid stabilization system protein ParE